MEEPAELNENFWTQVIIDIFREAMFLELKEVGKETILSRTVPRYEWELPDTI